MIFSDESQIYTHQEDDDETFDGSPSNETHNDHCLKKTIKPLHSVVTWGCIKKIKPLIIYSTQSKQCENFSLNDRDRKLSRSQLDQKCMGKMKKLSMMKLHNCEIN